MSLSFLDTQADLLSTSIEISRILLLNVSVNFYTSEPYAFRMVYILHFLRSFCYQILFTFLVAFRAYANLFLISWIYFPSSMILTL